MVNSKAKKILAFHRSFLASIEREGRLFEVGMVSDYKRRTGDLMKDVMVAPKLFLRGKLGLMPHRIKDQAGVKAIFKRVLGKG
jgi:heterodisulfide reductase subunit C